MMDYEFRINPGIGMDEIDGFDMANFHIYIYMYVCMYICICVSSHLQCPMVADRYLYKDNYLPI